MSAHRVNAINQDLPIKKLYWRMVEVVKLLGVDSSCIRYWIKEFQMPVRKTTPGGQRIFNERELDRLKTIKRLLRDEGLRIWAVKKRLATGQANGLKPENYFEDETDMIKIQYPDG